MAWNRLKSPLQTVSRLAVLAGCLAAPPLAVWVSPPALGADDKPAVPVSPAPVFSTAPALAEPVIKSDAKFFGRRASVWSVEGVQFALLEGDVTIDIGAYGFRADRASLRIETARSQGTRIRHLSIYLVNARPREGGGPIAAGGSKLFVTASTTGELDIATDLWKEESAAGDALVAEAQGRFERYLTAISARPEDLPADIAKRLQIGPTGRPPAPPPPEVPLPKNVGKAMEPPELSKKVRIAPEDGTVAFNADKFVFEKGKNGESTVSLIGGVRVMYQDAQGQTALSLRAENAVIFLGDVEAGAVAGNRARSTDVRGVYLEDNVVATDGDYTLRAPRIYYDLKQNKAVILRAVFFAWDVKRKVPLYVRADHVRQESSKSWSAQAAVLTTSEFAEPHVAIASDNITFRQEERIDGTTSSVFRATDTTLQVGGVPVMYLPAVTGEGQDLPLRGLSLGFNSNSGPDVRTRWDVFSLLGREPLEGVDLTGDADIRGEHGLALGLNLSYTRPEMYGFLDSYIVLYDTGNDELADNRNVDHEGNTRGYLNAFHRQYLRDNWELTVQAGYVSDETFLEEFFRGQAETEKPYETSIYLKKQADETAFTFLLQYDLNDFTPQTTTLQAPGYNVDKSPELAWRQLGTALLGNRLTYFGETRLSYMRARPGKDSPANRGFNDAQSLAVFGIADADTDFADAFRGAGMTTSHRLRFDSRHEVQAPLKLSIFNVTPFASGRLTAYDKDFEDFAGEDEQARFFGTLGARIHTEFSRSYDDVEWAIFDVHRLRHVVEPGIDLSYAGSTINPEDIPVYDSDVEALHEGYTVRLGLRNTLQTQRGGEGRWRSVDWLTLDTDMIFRGDDANDAAIPRYFSYRPEYSPGGDHFYTRLLWAVSDSLAAVAEMTYRLEDEDQVAQWRVGGSYQQTPHLKWHAGYEEIHDLDSRLLSWGFTYQLTTLYTLGFRHVMDLEAGQARAVDLTVVRQLSRWKLAAVLSFDEIENETTFSIMLVPDGARTGRVDSMFRNSP
jgi:lipopolysaccharide assembly outer membrane protein LptD (OstA)